MKDFIETVKAGFQELPEFLSIIIILGMIAFVFGGIGGAINVFLVLFGAWAVVFIGFPFVVLVLGFVGKIYSICQKKFDKWNKNTPEKDFEEI